MRLMQLVGLRRLVPTFFRAPLRLLWSRLLRWEQYVRERSFYGRLLRKGDLVFDVGANNGGKTAAFLSLGASVVAIEPSPACTDYLRKTYRNALATGRLHIEQAAVGGENGELTLTVVDSDSAMCSGSGAFVKYAKTIGYTGARIIKVQAVTLDDLVQHYGMPRYIKIDVEGMDADVLRGLSQRPQLLSFEYHTALAVWDNTRECFNQIIRLGFREANLTEFVNPKFLFPSWMEIGAALAQVEEWRAGGTRWGDVVVR